MNPFMAIIKKVMDIIISKVGTVLHSHNRIEVPGMEIMNFSLGLPYPSVMKVPQMLCFQILVPFGGVHAFTGQDYWP